MDEWILKVPTYNQGAIDRGSLLEEAPEFGAPFVPMVIRPAEGVRVVLGTTDFWDTNAPDIQIERRPGGWVVFLQPVGGSDSSGFVHFLDDGRSFVLPERGATPPIMPIDFDDPLSKAVDRLPVNECKERCEFCTARLHEDGDNWAGLCPSCADKVSNYLDLSNLDDDSRDDAIQQLQNAIAVLTQQGSSNRRTRRRS